MNKLLFEEEHVNHLDLHKPNEFGEYDECKYAIFTHYEYDTGYEEIRCSLTKKECLCYEGECPLNYKIKVCNEIFNSKEVPDLNSKYEND